METEIAKIVTVEDKSELSAMLQPMEEAILSIEVLGRIILDKKENDNVDSGDIIAKIDSSQYQINTGIADASLNQAGANLSQTLSGAREQEKESAKATYDKANAVYENTLTASNGQIVAAGTPVFRFGNIDSLKLILPVPDHSIDNWTKGDIVTISLYGKEKQGIVTNIFAATNVMTGTIGVEVTVQNDEHNWVPGQVVVCSYVTKSQKSIWLPIESIISLSGEEPYYIRYLAF